jgi:hypothetical protein
MHLTDTRCSNRIRVMKIVIFRTNETISLIEMSTFLRDVSQISALVQMLLLLLTMFTGIPGVYTQDKGFMFISDNFCTKQLLAGLFMVTTLPSWILLACSISLDENVVKRKMLIGLLATPFPIGIGIVFFSLCTTPVMHYVYVNLFVLTVASIHLTIALTAKHFIFLQVYSILLIGTSISGVCFMTFALITPVGRPSVERNVAVIAEYIAVSGFIVCNSLCIDRIKEHIDGQ